jgi:5-methylthioadenosine/S-adenosylhomocysteine deaminase
VELQLENARMVTVDDGMRVIERGWLRIAGRSIAALGVGGAPPVPLTVRRMDLGGKLVLPGLVNCHLHSHEHIQKARFDNLPMELWQHYVRPPSGIALGPEQVYLRTMIGILEMLRTGTTAAVDDVNHFPAYDAAEIEAVFRAYEDAGMRACVSVSMLDRRLIEGIPYVGETLPPALLHRIGAVPTPDRARLLELAGHWAARRSDKAARVRFLIAPSAPSRCSDAFLTALMEVAERHDLPYFTHVAETRIQIVTGDAFYGESLVAHLDRLGLLRPRLAAFHCVWVGDEDIARLARGGVTLVHSPVSNLKLGSGIAPVRKQLDAGIPLALGCDGCGSNDSLNSFVNLRLAALIHKATQAPLDRWVGAREALVMATRGGARAIGLADRLGAIAEGWLADLIVIDCDRPEWLPAGDPVNQLAFCETGANVVMAIVDGEVVMEDGRLTRIDEAAIRQGIREMAARIAPALAAAEQQGDELRPHMTRIYERALREGGRWSDLPGPFFPRF